MLGPMPVIGVHWGLGCGILACVIAYVLMDRTTLGFAARIAGGNVRAAQIQGLPVGRLIVGFTALGGPSRRSPAISSRGGAGNANGTLAAGYG